MYAITPEFSEIIGLLCAEGHYQLNYRTFWGKNRGKPYLFKNKKSMQIQIYNKDRNLLEHFQHLLNKEFAYFPNITKHGKINICRRDIIRKILGQTDIGHMKWTVPESVMKGSEIIKISFLRGYFDGDGTASNNIRFFSTNRQGLLKVALLLDSLKFKHTMPPRMIKPERKPLYIIQISRKEKERFLNILQPISKRPGIMRG